MKKQLQQLIEWHEKFQVPYKIVPAPFLDALNDDVDERKLIKLRYNVMREELEEWYSSAKYNMPIEERAKELADILYTVFGTIITEGLQDVIEQVFDAVHESNMSKLGSDGKPIKRADGKVLKGPNYQEPDLTFLQK